MNEKVPYPGQWWFDPEWASWKYSKPGLYDPLVAREADVALGYVQVNQLIAALDEAGWIKPRLDERLREEDLRITHRLLDIVGAVVSGRLEACG